MAGREKPGGAKPMGGWREPAKLIRSTLTGCGSGSQRSIPTLPIKPFHCLPARRNVVQEDRDILLVNTLRARNQNLAYLPGIALARCRSASPMWGATIINGRELLQSADIYAGLHRQVWDKLSQDVEEALKSRHSAAVELLLEAPGWAPRRRPPVTSASSSRAPRRRPGIPIARNTSAAACDRPTAMARRGPS